MGDLSVNKVSSQSSPEGDMGQKYLASGIHLSMRLWESLPPAPPTSLTQRDYETVGFVIRGRANLKIEGQILSLSAGWIYQEYLPKTRGTQIEAGLAYQIRF